MGGYTGGGALGGLLQGMMAGRELRMRIAHAADQHQQAQQAIEQQQHEMTSKAIMNRMNLEMMGARPVDAMGAVEQEGALPALDTNQPKQSLPEAAPSSALGMMGSMINEAPGAGEARPPQADTIPQGNPLDALRATAAQEPPAPTRFTRKANKGQVVSMPWLDGQKLSYELPTPQEQMQRQSQMEQAKLLREKLGMANADRYVLEAFGVPMPDQVADTLGFPRGSKAMRGEIPGLTEKAAQTRKAEFMEVPAGTTVLKTGAMGGGTPGATASGAGSAAAGAPGAATPAAPGGNGVVAFQNPPLEPPNIRSAKSWYAQSLGKQPGQLTPDEQAAAVQKWNAATMNPLDKALKEEELKAKPLDRKVKESTLATQSVQRQIQNQQLDLAGDTDMINMAAQRYLQSNQMPPLGMGSPLLRAKIMVRAGEIAKENGLSPEQIPALQDTYKALSAALTDLQKRQGQIEAFEKGGAANLDNFIRLAQSQVDTGSPMLNRTFRGAAKQVFGSPEQAAADAARIAAFNEISKILSGSLGNAGITDSARKEAEGLLHGAYTMKQILEVSKVLRQDMKNRTQAYGEQIKGVREQMQGLTGPKAAVTSAPGGKIAVTSPEGTPGFIDADKWDAAEKRGFKRQ